MLDRNQDQSHLDSLNVAATLDRVSSSIVTSSNLFSSQLRDLVQRTDSQGGRAEETNSLIESLRRDFGAFRTELLAVS